MTLSCTDRGTGASNASSSTTYAFSPASNFAAGSIAVVCISADNSSTGGSTNNVSSVTDSLGNTWYVAQKPIFDNGVASAGIQGAIAWTPQSKGPLQTSTTITVTFGNALTAKSYTLHEVSASAGLPTYKTGGVGTGSAVAAAGTYSMTTGSIAVGNLLICTLAMESGTTQTYTADSDTTNGTWSAVQYSEVGSTTSGNCIGSQYKLQTTTGSTQSYNATLAAAADSIGAWAEFTEVDPVVLKTPRWPDPPSRHKAREPSGVTDIPVNILVQGNMFTPLNYTVRGPLITPLRTKRRIEFYDDALNLLGTTLGAVGGPQTYDVSLTEAVTATDTPASIADLYNAIAEAAAAGEAISGGLLILLTIAEAVAAGESLTNIATLSNALAEAVTAAEGEVQNATALNALTEAVTAAEAAASIGTLANALSEVVTAGEALVDTLSSSSYTESVTESVTAADVVASIATLVAAVSEAAAAAEALVNNATLGNALTETVTAGETVTGGLTIDAALTETVTAGDALSQLGVLLSTVSEAAAALETLGTIATLTASTADAIVPSDSYSDDVPGSGGGGGGSHRWLWTHKDRRH